MSALLEKGSRPQGRLGNPVPRLLVTVVLLGIACGCQCNPCRSGSTGLLGSGTLCPPQFDNFYCRYYDEFHARLAARTVARQQLKCMRPATVTCDFREGFENAFEDVAVGSRGGIPPQPPAPYWNKCARTPGGHARVEQWYAGYAAGLELALAQHGGFNRVHTAGATVCGDQLHAERVPYERASTCGEGSPTAGHCQLEPGSFR